MERRAFIGILGVLTSPLAAKAQPAKKVARLGYLLLVPLAEKPSPEREAFLHGLRELGYMEGQSIAIEYRSAAWNVELLQEHAADLVALKVDVIVAPGPQAALAAKEATKAIPIVITAVADPVSLGLVASLHRPGGNVTGLTVSLPELSGKRLELLKEAVPRASPVAVLWNPANPATAADWKETLAAARALGVTLQSMEVSAADDFVRAFSAMSRRRPAALMTIVDTVTHPYREIIADFALKNRLPTIASSEFAEAGGLMSYGPNLPEMFRRAAAYVDKILKGAKPADLPVEQPRRFELVINLKTAKALGLTIPPSILVRADRVIE
jgi:putative tryptophan/tyrosine transport system substrate-binding protein